MVYIVGRAGNHFNKFININNTMDKLPIELLHKIFLYKIPPPHYFAYKKGLRFVSDNELLEDITYSDIKIRTEEDELNDEWEEFMESEVLFNHHPY